MKKVTKRRADLAIQHGRLALVALCEAAKKDSEFLFAQLWAKSLMKKVGLSMKAADQSREILFQDFCSNHIVVAGKEVPVGRSKSKAKK